MGASNPERLALALDGQLDHEVELVLYGRGAISLGFENPPPAVHLTKDIDAIIRMRELDNLVHDEQFWDARDAVNEQFESEGLYITHLFQEDQVFHRPQWEDEIVPALRPQTRYLKLFRPAAIDLILTKMMRGDDPHDLDDVEFMIRSDRISITALEQAFVEAILTDIPELHDAFERAKPAVREIAQRVAAESV